VALRACWGNDSGAEEENWGQLRVQHTEGETRAPLIGPENAGDKRSENGVDGMAAGMQQTLYIEPKLI
jgi:hypothetical protein